MPAYNPPPQVLFSPVTNYYQGKAIRTQQAMAEKELETYDQKLALDERRVAAQEQNAQTNEGVLGQRVKEYEYKVGQETARKNAWDLYYTVADINKQVQGGDVGEEEALQKAVPALLDYADSLPEEAKEQADAIRSAIQDRDGLTLEEWQEIGGNAERTADYYGFINREEPFVLADGAELYNSRGERIARNPKDFSSKENSPDFEPPNNNEIEAAEKIIAADEQLSDLESSAEKRVAAQFLANEIRQLQATLNIPYDEAAAMAVARLRQKLTSETDFFSGSDEKLDITSSGLASNEYLIRGEVWVKEPDGSIHPKNP